MSQPIDPKIKALKSSIFQITSHHTGGERAKQDLALSVFVKFSLGVMLNQLVSRYRHYGITDLELAEHIFIDDTHFALDEKLFSTLNAEALATSVRLYKELVEALPAFSDVLTMLIEEIALFRRSGEGLGQFLTRTDLSSLLGSLLHTLESQHRATGTDSWTFYDSTCGAGSLQLPRVAIEARKGREKTRLINLEMNDIDPSMCCAAALQFVASIVIHEQDLHQLRVTCSNALTETKPHSKSLVVIKTPEKLFERVRLAHANIIFESQNRIRCFNSLTEKLLCK
ncbi:hypothetical protein PSE10A_46570 [Pseudomonas amygdali pv. eriobotryae]|uniref:DNA methylase adenine-specific domain-containing protein n=1 Tax=Pseudomonas amygdali pv. eriobotryae TaxID=129137 RepID=A0A9P3AI23_PSEA0|nr:hypothetical protein [Pseudomonas amygdali]GFZ62146.1 hypothetical protein PSE10A_46570 [Pseudomonas amygdali pv. eriobotryae]